jgi:hypothetical protein
MATSPEVCWLCGEGPKARDPWTADAVHPEDLESELRRVHLMCSAIRGARRDYEP